MICPKRVTGRPVSQSNESFIASGKSMAHHQISSSYAARSKTSALALLRYTSSSYQDPDA